MHSSIVADLAIVLVVAAITGMISRKLKQPPVLGYLFAGLIVGPYLPVPLFADVHRMQELAELGVILVMFGVGLEFRIRRLAKVVPQAGVAVLIECAALLGAGYGIGLLLGWSTPASLFLGACISISSTMTVSKILTPEATEPAVRDLVLSMLVLQDVMAIALIAAMTAIAAGGGMSAVELSMMLGQLALVLGCMIGFGLLVVPSLIRRVSLTGGPEVMVVVSVGLCFGFAQLAAVLGYSVALGAFVAGMLVSESGEGEEIEHLVAPIKDLFAAVFFVAIGMTVDPVVAFEFGPIALLVTGVVIVVQLLSVSIGGVLAGNGTRRSIAAGIALGQIGEFAFIIAAIGVEADVVPAALSPVMVTVAVLTTFTTPLLLKRTPKIVTAIDRALPARLRETLSLYTCWIERVRERSSPVEERSLRRTLRSVVIDMVAVTAILGVAVHFDSVFYRVLTEQGVELDHQIASALFGFIAVVLAIPFGYLLMKNITALSHRIAEPRDARADTPSGRVAEAASRALLQVGVIVALGLPAVVVLGWLGSPYPGAGLGIVLIVALVLMWRRAGEVHKEVRTGAGRILDMLAKRVADDEPDEKPALIPGLNDLIHLSLVDASYAVGKTLAELNIRARTGATVVAIHHPDDPDAVVPHGNENLSARDALTLMGTREGKQAALSLLTAGDSDESVQSTAA